MDLKMLTVGSLDTNCYWVWCNKSKEAVVIDPGFDQREEAKKVLDIVKEYDLNVKFIVNTHGHPDHTSGNGAMKDATGAPILIHKLDAKMLSAAGRKFMALFGVKATSLVADGFLEEGAVIRFGESVLRVLHTPGHSPGSISLVGSDCVFTGDTLFAGSIGRVDLPGGSGREILQSLRGKLAVLPDEFVVYPGHGPRSTVEEEKRSNPFLQNDFDRSLLL